MNGRLFFLLCFQLSFNFSCKKTGKHIENLLFLLLFIQNIVPVYCIYFVSLYIAFACLNCQQYHYDKLCIYLLHLETKRIVLFYISGVYSITLCYKNFLLSVTKILFISVKINIFTNLDKYNKAL